MLTICRVWNLKLSRPQSTLVMYTYVLEYRHRVLRFVVPKVHLGPNTSVLLTVLTPRWQPTFLLLYLLSTCLHLTIFAFNHLNHLIKCPPFLPLPCYMSSRLPIVISSQRLALAICHITYPTSPPCRSRPEGRRLLGSIPAKAGEPSDFKPEHE